MFNNSHRYIRRLIKETFGTVQGKQLIAEWKNLYLQPNFPMKEKDSVIYHDLGRREFLQEILNELSEIGNEIDDIKPKYYEVNNNE